MDDYVLDARVEHIRNFVHILSAVRLSKKQHVRVSVSERGLTFVSLDDSKSLQAQANFRAEAFRDYRVNPSAATGTQQPPAGGGAAGSFGLALGPLIDVLNVFAPLDGDAELSIRWPDRDGRLVLAAHAERGAPDRPLRGCTHAAVAPEERPGSGPGGGGGDAELVFRGERNAFMLPTSTLKEIVDDLEWPAAPISLRMSSDPDALCFSARGREVGELRVDVDARGGRLTEFSCAEPGRWTYRHRFLKAATGVPSNLIVGPASAQEGDSPTMTRVAIGENGMLKVVHLVHLSRALPTFGGVGASRPPGATGGTADGTASQGGPGGTLTQRGTGYMVPVTFIAYPEEEEDDEEGDEGDTYEDGL